MLLPKQIRDVLGTHGEISPKEMAMPLFVIGNMRSGTTLLVNKLSQHPQLLKIGSELNDIWTAIGGADCLDKCEYKSAVDADFRYAFNMSSYFFRFIQDSRSIKRHAMRLVSKLKQQQGRVFYDWGNIVPVNKSPHLLNKIPYIHALFPDSPIIFIIRDIYAYSSSMKIHFEDYFKRTGKLYVKTTDHKACWHRLEKGSIQYDFLSYPPYFKSIPEMWIRLNKIALEDLGKMDPQSFLLVDYNEFIRDQQVQLQRIFDFLDLESKHKKKEKNIAQSVTTYKNTSTSGDPLTKWKQLLSKEEQEIIMNIMEENKDSYNYILERTEQLKH
jgi:hypothetical protein